MSITGKKWVLKNDQKKGDLFEKILASRKELKTITGFHDPFLMRDMKKVVERIEKAVKDKERVMIFGDYDVDGITGTAILAKVFKEIGVTFSYRLPHREKDGYGINMRFIDEFIENEINLLITTDCGISCFDEVEKAVSNGIDVIITDHHHIPEKIPNAYAILHPKLQDCEYPFDELTGAGVALKLAQALCSHFEIEVSDDLIDLATLGTIGDMAPVTDENHYLISEGVEKLRATKNVGLQALAESAGIELNSLSSQNLGFIITPRINAAGRVSTPYAALNLLLEETDFDKINRLAYNLENLNKQRRDLTDKAVDDAAEVFKYSNEPLLMAYSDRWHIGITGLIAGKVMQRFGKPAIILHDKGDLLVASCRSLPGFHIVDAIKQFSDLLVTFGGHAEAAGFTIKKDNFEGFKKGMLEFAEKQLMGQDLKPILEIDCMATVSDLNLDLYERIQSLAPFGMKNELPLVLFKGAYLSDARTVGKGNKHLSFKVRNEGNDIKGIAFSMGPYHDEIRAGKTVDIVAEIDKDTWNGNSAVQLIARDFGI